MSSHSASHLKADLLIVLVTIISAVGWILSKMAVSEMPPLLFMGIRFVIAGLVLLALRMPDLAATSRQDLGWSSFAGAVFAAAMTFWIIGLQMSSHVGEAAFINSLSMVMVPLLTWLFLRERPNRSTWLSLPVAVAGLALLSLKNGFHAESSQLILLIGAIIISSHFILVGRIVARVPALRLTAISLFSCGVFMLGISALRETWPAEITPHLWGLILLSALLASSFRFLLQTYAQSLASTAHVAVIMMLEPIWVTIFSAAWFGETLARLQWAGCALIFISLLVSRWQAIRQMLRPA